MGLSHAVPIKETERGETDFLYFASSTMQGYREEQEDAHCNAVSLEIDPSVDKDYHHCMFAVFDGHAGCSASEFCAKNLVDVVVESEKSRLKSQQQQQENQCDPFEDDQLFTDSFVKCDSNLKQYYESQDMNPSFGAGSTGITVWCRFPKSGNTSPDVRVVCANVGDSRAIVFDQNQTIALSEDQKPNDEIEKERIEKAGKHVAYGRVNGALAVARAFGDFRYKDTPNISDIEQAVSVEPAIKRYNLAKPTSKDQHQFVLLACDGLWDKLSNTDASEWVSAHLREYHIFDETIALTDDQVEPLHISWISKRVQEWSGEDYSAWMDCIPKNINRYFKTTFQKGSDLCATVQDDIAWQNLMETKTGISYTSAFEPDVAGVAFRKVVLDRIAEQEKNTAKKPITSTVDKLAFLTERLIDYAVFKKRSEDNVSVTIVLLKPQ